MYKTINDFLNDWKTESEFTLKLFSNIPDQFISTKAAENIRSLGRLAWHITQTVTEMPHSAGLSEIDVLENKPVPQTFKKICDIYKNSCSKLAEIIKGKWSDSELTEKIEMYGQQWEKHKILSVLINHQIHHRAQMTVIMRLFDLKVPGLYGPSKEEWTNYGMSPQE